MKTTEYFSSNFKTNGQLEAAINEANTKKKEFLYSNTVNIGKIDSEDIKIFSKGNQFAVVIRLTYYPK